MFLKVFSFLVSSQNQLTFAASSICFWYFGTLGGPLFLPKMPGYCLVESASLFWSLYILGPQKWLVRGLVFSLRYIAHTLSNLLTTSSAILPSQAQIPFLPWLSQLRKRAGSRPALAASWCRGDKRAWTHSFMSGPSIWKQGTEWLNRIWPRQKQLVLHSSKFLWADPSITYLLWTLIWNATLSASETWTF